MQKRILRRRFFLVSSLLIAFHTMGFTCQGQQKRADITEMKDTVRWYVTKIKKMENDKQPDQSVILLTREKLVVLMILNLNAACGSLPSPSSKIEVLEGYWKCVFDKAPYGKKFFLN